MGDENSLRDMSPLRTSPRRKRNSLPPSLPTIRSVSGTGELELAPDAGLPPQPFNFTPAYFTPVGQTQLKASRTSQRRGHRYKHSSVSMQFFKEPEARAPLAIPVSRPVPTLHECWQSITRAQFLQMLVCLVKIVATLVVYNLGSPEMRSVSTLAHVIAYQTVVETTVVIVSVLANFDVWTRSSMKLPFALKRIEVLVAFGLSTVLIFIGGDVISHGIEELVSGHSHDHRNENMDPHSERSLLRHFLPVVISFLVLVSGKSHSSIPLTLPTIALALIILIGPVFPHSVSEALDTALTPTIAVYMISLGWKGVKVFGSMLSMSYGGEDKTKEIRHQILADKSVLEVLEVGVWQVHYDLWLATSRIAFRGDGADAERVRHVAESAIRTSIPVEGVDWEMTIEVLHSKP